MWRQHPGAWAGQIAKLVEQAAADPAAFLAAADACTAGPNEEQKVADPEAARPDGAEPEAAEAGSAAPHVADAGGADGPVGDAGGADAAGHAAAAAADGPPPLGMAGQHCSERGKFLPPFVALSAMALTLMAANGRQLPS